MEKLNRVLHLNRSAINFHSTITIDQLINIPLLSGRFKIKWKFNNPLIVNNSQNHHQHQNHQDTTLLPSSSSSSSSSASSASSSSSGSSSSHHRIPSQQSNSQLVELPIKSEPTGSTNYIPIKNHGVLFRYAFHCPISIEVDKNGNPLPSLLTIILKEEHVNEIGKRIVTRHGLIHIDLTQYTPIIKNLNHNQRSPSHHDIPPSLQSTQHLSRIEKAKFLLKDCKTNAHLKIQIQMDYIGGWVPLNIPKNLVAPSLLPTHSHVSNNEAQNSKGLLSQHEDTRSIFSICKINAYSPGSSVISDGSSQHMSPYRTRKLSAGNKSNLTNTSDPTATTNRKKQQEQKSNSGTVTRKNHPSSPQAISSQLAENVIDLIFSPYYPSSSPVPFHLTSSNSNPTHPDPNNLVQRLDHHHYQPNKSIKKLTNLNHPLH